jgi:pre-mRNA-splicing helicase BRR2
MEDADRDDALQLDPRRMADVARFVNRYPNVDVQFQVSEEKVLQGDDVTVQVVLDREMDEDEEASVGPVIAPYYPGSKDEGWWLVVGDAQDKTILAIRRTTLQKQARIKLAFPAPEKVGDVECKLFFMCDSYMGVDQEFEFVLHVEQGQQEPEAASDEGDAMDESQ